MGREKVKGTGELKIQMVFLKSSKKVYGIPVKSGKKQYMYGVIIENLKSRINKKCINSEYIKQKNVVKQ